MPYKNNITQALALLLLFGLSLWLSACGNHQPRIDKLHYVENVLATYHEPVYAYGVRVDTFELVSAEIMPNQFLSDILLQYNVPYSIIAQLDKNTTFDIKKMRAGNPYTLLCTKNDSSLTAHCMIYEQDKVNYVVFDLKDSVTAQLGQKEVTYKERLASGVIYGSLYGTMENLNISPVLALEMSEIYAWTIDFYRIQAGDKFKVIYTEKYVEDEMVGIGDVKACLFNHFGNDHYAFFYQKDSIVPKGFYDEEGGSLKQAFLQAPVKYSRISSKFSYNRLHPVTGVNKPHLGTDYAADYGTPIYSTADGTVIAAQYKQYNGNYVKVQHNATYTTQYLHMQSIAPGIRTGVHVEQGQVIGYVGSTGLATGPHVCYRFWKNGEQVDPYREDLPKSVPIEEPNLTPYLEDIKPIKAALDEIPYNEENELSSGSEPAI